MLTIGKKWFLTINIFMLVFVLNAQTSIVTTPSTNTGNCDGSASVNLITLLSNNWYWTNSTYNVIQQGGTTISNLCPGNYFLNYIDSTGANVNQAFNIALGSPSPCINSTLNVNLTTTPVIGTIDSTTTSIPCNGTIVAQVYGGTSPYTYNWSSSNGGISPNSTGQYLYNICTGNYYVTVIDANGCSITIATAVIFIDTSANNNGGGSTPPPVAGNGNDCANFNTYLSPVSISSPGVCDGLIGAQIYGSTSTIFHYNWLSSNNISFSDTNVISNLCTGNYYLITSDGNGCTDTNFVTLHDSIIPNYSLQGFVIPQNVSADNVCDGGATAYINGGVSPYSYSYTNGSNTSVASGLCVGLQGLTVTDANGVSIYLDFVIAAPISVYTTTNFQDSTIIDSLFSNAVSNCSIDYNTINSIFISSINYYSNNIANVTWTVNYNDTSSVQLTSNYFLNDSLNGVYSFTLQIYCPNKSIGHFISASDQYYINKSTSGISEISTSISSIVYPNPFNDFIEISIENPISTDVIITDIMGKQIHKTTIDSKENRIELNNLSSGQYVLILKNKNGISTHKIIK